MIRKLWQGLRSLRTGNSLPDWEFEERRELIRLRCHLDVEYTIGQKKHQGRIVDMSLGGMMLRCFQTPRIGHLTDVTYLVPSVTTSEATVRCKVQWIKSRPKDFVHFVGLSYQSSEGTLRRSWVKEQLKDLGFRPETIFQKRKYMRVTCYISARFTTDDGSLIEGRLYNLGPKGALLEGPTAVKVGHRVELQVGPHQALGCLTLSGCVASCQDVNRLFFVGVEFSDMTQSQTDLLSQYLLQLLDEEGNV